MEEREGGVMGMGEGREGSREVSEERKHSWRSRGEVEITIKRERNKTIDCEKLRTKDEQVREGETETKRNIDE